MQRALRGPQRHGRVPSTRRGPRRGRTRLAVATLNGSCWKTAWTAIQMSRWDIVCVQEHRLHPTELADAATDAARHGWRVHGSPCTTGKAGGASAGVAIVVRASLTAGPTLLPLPPLHTPARLAAVAVRLKGAFMVVYAAYFLDGDPLGAYNKRLLAELLEHIDSHKELSIIRGDFNITPDTMTDLLASAGSAITAAATDAPTCRVGRGTTLDYFIADAP